MKTLLAILFSCLSLSAATYYVDYSAGSDSNNGTSTATPWKHSPGDSSATGTPASTTLAAGDAVKFKGGITYTGQVVVSASGTLGNVITLDGNSAGDWGTGRAVIDCNYTLNASAIKLNTGVSHIKINNFELRNAGGYADDDPIVIAAANGDYGNSTNAVRTQKPGWGLLLNSKNTNIYAANLYVHNVGQWRSTIGWDGRSISGVGIQLTSPNSVTLTNCEVTKVGATGIGIYAATNATDVLITDCYLHDDIPQWSMDIAPQGVGVTLTNIVVTKTRFIDLWSDWTGTPDDPNGTGTTAPHQNYIFARTAGTLSYWTNNTVSRCFFGETSDTHTGGGGTGSIFLSTGPSLNIYNNIFSRPWSYTGIIVIGYAVPSGMTQVVRVFNNTFLRGSGTTITVFGNTTANAQYIYSKNNILINDPGLNANAVMVTTANSLNYPTEMDYNLYWSPDWTAAQMYVAIIGNYSTVANLQSNGWETHGQYGNPLLTDYQNATPALRDYTLTSSSPAIGAGTNLSDYFTTDYNGNARPSTGAWDVGAYQYTAAEQGGGSTGGTGATGSSFTSGSVTIRGGVILR